MKNIVAFLLTLIIIVAYSNKSYAHNEPHIKSSKQLYNEKVMERVSAQFAATVAWNKTHSKKKYFIQDKEALKFFFAHYTSEKASKLFLDNYKDLGEAYEGNIDKYIEALREKYLPEEYKDYQIYFMVAGLFYTPDVSKTDVTENLDWKNVRSLSFDKTPATSTQAPYVSGPAQTKTVMQDYSKVNLAVYKSVKKQEHITLSLTDKTIVIYKWLLFDIDIKDGTLESYLKGKTNDLSYLSSPGATQPVMFMSDGYIYKKNSTALSEINALNKFLSSDGDYSDIISVENMTYQRNKLMKDITNAFVYFYQKKNSLIPADFCSRTDEDKESILVKLAPAYQNAATGDWETAPFRNPIIFSNINWDTRKCILDYLLNKVDCNDAKGLGMNNACENMVIDAIGGAKGDDQKEVLKYFNDPIYYKKLFDRLHDAGGEDNYTGVTYALVSMAARHGYFDTKTKNPISDALFDFNNTTKQIDNLSYQETSFEQSVDYSKLHFDISSTISQFISATIPPVPVSNSNAAYDCTPFTPVQFVYSDDLEFSVQKPDGSRPEVGEIVTVPALYLQWLIHTDFKIKALQAANTTLLVVGLVSGVSTYATATTIAARLWAAGDIFFTSIALVTSSAPVKKYVKDKWGPAGLEVISTINTIGSWYGGAYMGVGAINYLSKKLEEKAFRTILEDIRRDANLRAQYAKESNAVNEISNKLDENGWKLKAILDKQQELLAKLDNFAGLKKQFLELTEARKAKFLYEFDGISDFGLDLLNSKPGLLKHWQDYGEIIQSRRYPDVGHTPWETTTTTIRSHDNPLEVHMLDELEKAGKPTSSEVCKSVACAPDFETGLVIRTNVKSLPADHIFVDELKIHMDYLDLIKQDFDKGGTLYKKLYTNVPELKIKNAGLVGHHSEVLAINEIIKLIKKHKNFTPPIDLDKIFVLIRGTGKFGNMCRCPHCFFILYGARTIGNL